jgi:hypothetical protein
MEAAGPGIKKTEAQGDAPVRDRKDYLNEVQQSVF